MIRKKIVSAMIVAVMTASSVIPCFAATAVTTNEKAGLRIHEGPQLSSPVVKLIPPSPSGKIVENLGNETNGLFQIVYEGTKGWVSSDYLETRVRTTNTKMNLNLRKSPNTSSAVIAKIPPKSEVIVLGGITKGFYKVKYGGKTGYVSAEYISFKTEAKAVEKTLVWPAESYYITTLNYYWNNGNPKAHGTRYGWSHAIDIAGGGDVVSAADGVIEDVGYQKNGFGNYVVIRHDDGNRSLYGHLKSVSVKKGQRIAALKKIGVMGSTGNSTGVHLHFELEKGNPMDIFRDKYGSKLKIGTNVYKANHAMRNKYGLCKSTAEWIHSEFKVEDGWYVHK